MDNDLLIKIELRIQEAADKYYKAMARNTGSDILSLLRSDMSYLREMRGRIVRQN